MIRPLYYKGMLYPDTKKELDELFECWSTFQELAALDFHPSVAVLPHGPYECSGLTTFATLSNVSFSESSRVVIVGPSHHFIFEGISVFVEEAFESLDEGETVACDIDYAMQLKDEYALSSISGAHRERSTEVIVPFITHFAPDLPVVEVIYGARSEEALGELIADIMQESNTFLIVSSDLSHNHSEVDAHKIDRHILNGFMSLSESDIREGEACGLKSLINVTQTAREEGFLSEVIDYRTSADCGGDKQRVTGYVGALFGKKL